MASGSQTNGSSSRRVLRPGVYAPTMTFFDKQSEDLDISTIKEHAVRLAKAGLSGLVTMGSNGEAVHMTREEKTAVTKATREALDEAGFADVPVIAGCSENSVRLTLELLNDASKAGAEYALILPPSYYRAQSSEALISEYYITVANESPLPIIIYSYPGAVSGIDLDSDLIIKLVNATNGKICGTKFTCGNTGKLTRVAAATKAWSIQSQGSGWIALGGLADMTVQTAASGGSGIIAGGANVLPKLCVKVWDLCASGEYDKAIELQKVLSKCDWVLTKSAIAGTKAAIEMEYGYGGYPRRPLQRLSDEESTRIKEGIAEAMKIESSL